MRKKRLLHALMAVFASTPVFAATPTTWTSTTTVGATTVTIEFNDWGYTGPTNVGANDFQVGTGFNSSSIGQIQNVITTGPDWKTPDPSYPLIEGDNYSAYPPDYSVSFLPNANMDSTVNFYRWGYTTVPGSTFNNMQIDTAGNYFIAKNDMSFQYYDVMKYRDTTGTNPDATYDTNINFQPYAISDAKGWCGSVLNSNPNGVAPMAGQVTFDFAFDAYMNNEPSPGFTGGGSAIQIVPGFVMRSYGSYHINWSNTYEGDIDYYGSAVMNNTNPDPNDPNFGQLDPNYQNKVSFLGGGVVPTGVWVNIHSVREDGSWLDYSVASAQGPDGTTDGEVREDGAVWHFNAFAGFAFLMRADGSRTLTWINPVTGHSDYVSTDAAAYTSIGMSPPQVPVPAALWLFGSGLMGLAGFARCKKRFPSDVCCNNQ